MTLHFSRRNFLPTHFPCKATEFTGELEGSLKLSKLLELFKSVRDWASGFKYRFNKESELLLLERGAVVLAGVNGLFI